MKRSMWIKAASLCLAPMLALPAAAQAPGSASVQETARATTPAPAPAGDPKPPAETAPPDAPGAEAVVGPPEPPAPERFAPTGWNDGVLQAVLRADRTLEATTFKEFHGKHPAEALWIVHWCHAKLYDLATDSNERMVCTAAEAAATKESEWTGRIENVQGLEKISIFQLAEMARKFNPPSCAGFGLIVPLYSVRLSRGGGTEVSGPVDAGLGGGYYWGNVVCRPNFSTGPEVFAYSEGLDPSGEFQLGIGAGWQLTAYRYFQFGIAVGYDLYRRVPVADPEAGSDAAQTNGIFAFGDMGPRPSMTFLFTFSITGGTTSGADAEE